tara:strand:- start:695 stop:1108 length:414 start_codon:yes stop_codon:yes gene_type:complete
MSKKKNNTIKKYLDDILGINTDFKKKRPTIQSKNRKHTCNILKNLQYVNHRAIGMKHDYNVDMVEYDNPFYDIIDSFLKIHFNQEQQNIINWWLYEKFLPTGDSLNLVDKKTEDTIPTDTPEDIYEILKNLSTKNEN